MGLLGNLTVPVCITSLSSNSMRQPKDIHKLEGFPEAHQGGRCLFFRNDGLKSRLSLCLEHKDAKAMQRPRLRGGCSPEHPCGGVGGALTWSGASPQSISGCYFLSCSEILHPHTSEGEGCLSETSLSFETTW